MVTTKNEKVISHKGEIIPFVVSSSNHERAGYYRSPFDRLRANGRKAIFRANIRTSLHGGGKGMKDVYFRERD